MIKLKLLIAFTFALLLYSCQFTDDGDFKYNVGTDFVTDPVHVVMIDSLTVDTYTTRTDSIATSKNSRFMVGRFENDYHIVTTCESYFRIEPSDVLALHSSSEFDGAEMILYLDGYSFGDTTKTVEMEIYRLTDDIEVDEETESIYNTTKFAHEATPIASFTVDLTDDDLDSVVVELPPAIGQEFYDLVYNEDEILSDADLFKEEYKGFLIKPANEKSSCIVGFVATPDSIASPRIKIKYHDNSIEDDLWFSYSIDKYESTSSSSSSSYVNYYASNYYENDYSKLIAYDFPDPEGKLSSKETSNVSFLQGGLNLATRIEIPSIDMLHYPGVGSVIKAELTFEPVAGTYINDSDLPSSLEMYLIGKRNINYGQLSLVGSSDKAYGVLHYNEEFKSETYYSFDITKFVVDEYLSSSDAVYALLLTLPQSSIAGDVDQLIIGNQDHPTNNMKLRVYLATY